MLICTHPKDQSSSSKGSKEEPRIEKSFSSEGEPPEAAESSRGELGQIPSVAVPDVVKPAKPAWKNASLGTLGKTPPATGPVMGAVTWPTLGDARHSIKTVPASEQPLKDSSPGGAVSANPTSQQVCS